MNLEVTGIGIESVPVKVFAVSVEELGMDHPRDLHIFTDSPPAQFEVYRNETVNIPAVLYEPQSISPLRVVVPFKKFTSYNVLRADVFRIKICAYAGPMPAELEFEFGVDSNSLWMRMAGSQNKIYSKIGAMHRRA